MSFSFKKCQFLLYFFATKKNRFRFEITDFFYNEFFYVFPLCFPLKNPYGFSHLRNIENQNIILVISTQWNLITAHFSSEHFLNYPTKLSNKCKKSKKIFRTFSGTTIKCNVYALWQAFIQKEYVQNKNFISHIHDASSVYVQTIIQEPKIEWVRHNV